MYLDVDYFGAGVATFMTFKVIGIVFPELISIIKKAGRSL